MKYRVVTLILGLVLLISPAYAEKMKRLVRIGYVDVEEIFEKYPNVEKVNERLREEKVYYESIQKKKLEEITKLVDDYRKQSKNLSAKQRADLLEKINKSKWELVLYIEDSNEKLDALEAKLKVPVRIQVLKYISIVSQEQGYAFTFRKPSENDDYGEEDVLDHDPKLDITENVLYKLKKDMKNQNRE